MNYEQTVHPGALNGKCSHMAFLSGRTEERQKRTAAQSRPSTRAGGQDDGSLTNSLKTEPNA